MRKYRRYNKRFHFDIAKDQTSFIPTIGIGYRHGAWKFYLLFMWLNFRCAVGFGKKSDYIF